MGKEKPVEAAIPTERIAVSKNKESIEPAKSVPLSKSTVSASLLAVKPSAPVKLSASSVYDAVPQPVSFSPCEKSIKSIEYAYHKYFLCWFNVTFADGHSRMVSSEEFRGGFHRE